MSSQPLRVLHLLTAFGHGGAEIWLLRLIEPLRALGVESGFVLKAPELGRLRHWAHERGAPTYEVRLPITHAGYIRGIARVAKEGAYDIVHTHELTYSAVGIAAGKLIGRPTVLTLHHYAFDPQIAWTRRAGIRQLREVYGRLSVQYATRNADAVTAFSHGVMDRVVPRRRQDGRCRVIRLCVDVRERAPFDVRARQREALGWSPTTPLIVHVGRLIEQKNHAGLLRVFRRVLRKRTDARLLLLGQGPLEGTIKAAAQDLVNEGVVKFLGLQDNVPDLLATADLLLFPSTTEGFGLVALEANACGLPVVGSRIAGLDEAVVDGETSMLHPLDDEEGMAASVLALLADPARAIAMGERGRSRARELFTPEASARLLADVYRRVSDS